MSISCSGTWEQGASNEVICNGALVQEPDQLTQLYELLNAAFTTPPVEDITAAFMVAFTMPLILWLTAWGFGVVINWFSGRTYEEDRD